MENKDNIENEDNESFLAFNLDEDMDISPHTSPVRVELIKTIAVTEKVTCLSSGTHAENGFATAEEEKSLSTHKEDAPLPSNQEINPTDLSGAKRPRTTGDEQQSSVHVIYNSLPRESRKKLEELLQQWSQWHAQRSSLSKDSSEVLESGEGIYFPALYVGVDKKASAVTFWMDNQTKDPQNKEARTLDDKSIPFYDRGYSLALTSTDGSGNLGRGLEVLDVSRCFNCGSYSHSLKECPKPRDNVAVNNAREQHKSTRNQNAASRNQTRYYQNTPKGKFDGLKPGVLSAETRQLLGLQELDPPPWLNRMREIGYPPGYLDPEEEEEDQPSGITIFADEESKEETEDVKILKAGCPEPPKKRSVEFPGINASIPEKANRRHWEAGSKSINLTRHHPYRRYDHSSESISRGQYLYLDKQDNQRPGFDLGWNPSLSRFSDSQDDQRPNFDLRWNPSLSRHSDNQDVQRPGFDLGWNPSLSSYSDRYRSCDLDYTPPSAYGGPSLSFERYLPDTGRRSPLTNYDYSNLGHYGSLP